MTTEVPSYNDSTRFGETDEDTLYVIDGNPVVVSKTSDVCTKLEPSVYIGSEERGSVTETKQYPAMVTISGPRNQSLKFGDIFEDFPTSMKKMPSPSRGHLQCLISYKEHSRMPKPAELSAAYTVTLRSLLDSLSHAISQKDYDEPLEIAYKPAEDRQEAMGLLLQSEVDGHTDKSTQPEQTDAAGTEVAPAKGEN